MYKPRANTAEWLTWVLGKIQELPYKATARYAFYRLVQEKGFSKNDYKKYIYIRISSLVALILLINSFSVSVTSS